MQSYTVTQGGCVQFQINILGEAINHEISLAGALLTTTANSDGITYDGNTRILSTMMSTPAMVYVVGFFVPPLDTGSFTLNVIPTCTGGQILNMAMTACLDPPPAMPTVPARKSNDDKFDDFAIYSGVAILSTWAFNKYLVNAPVKFTAKPTSNKSLQYNLSADINKNWSANFTVDKQVKINSETNNSNLYKLKFEYKF